MAAYTGDSRLNAAIIKARKQGIVVEISNWEIEVYFTPTSSVARLYSRNDRQDEALLLRDLQEALEAKEFLGC